LCFAAPLSAVVTAQAAAATTTLQFIHSAGFDADHNVKSAEFRYAAINPTTQLVEEKLLRVPVLVLLPIPVFQVFDCAVGPVFARVRCPDRCPFPMQIQSVTIEFNAKVSRSRLASAVASGGVMALQTLQPWSASTALATSYSFQKSQQASRGMEQRDFSVSVAVGASQDDLPVGVQFLLDTLDSSATTSSGPTSS
jgi:hypothetical protein